MDGFLPTIIGKSATRPSSLFFWLNFCEGRSPEVPSFRGGRLLVNPLSRLGLQPEERQLKTWRVSDPQHTSSSITFTCGEISYIILFKNTRNTKFPFRTSQTESVRKGGMVIECTCNINIQKKVRQNFGSILIRQNIN